MVSGNKKAQDLESRRFELELRRLELDERIHKHNTRSRLLTPPVIAVIIAVVGLLGTLLGVVLQSQSNNALQESRHDSEIVINGLSFETAAERREYLHFVAENQLLNNSELASTILSIEVFPGEAASGDDAVTVLSVSRTAIDWLVRFEVSSEEYYERRLSTPYWPGGSSGLNIGIGYDLGYTLAAQFRSDWSEYLSPGDVELLEACVGLKADAASKCGHKTREITVELDDAKQVFANVTLNYHARNTLDAYPGVEQLPPDAQGAMLSLVSNRGTRMSGDRRREMRELRSLVRSGDLEGMARTIRSMKRLWEDTSLTGLLLRREAEAELVENSDRVYKSWETVELGPSAATSFSSRRRDG